MTSTKFHSITQLITATCLALIGGLAQATTAPQLVQPVFATPSGAVTVTCDKSPGAGLCYALTDAVVDFTYASVKGQAAVDAVLNGQASSSSNLIVQAEMDVLPTDIVSTEIGKLAYYVSYAICSVTTSGEATSDSYNAQAIVAENKALPRLAAIQKAAGITNVKTCKLTLK